MSKHLSKLIPNLKRLLVRRRTAYPFIVLGIGVGDVRAAQLDFAQGFGSREANLRTVFFLNSEQIDSSSLRFSPRSGSLGRMTVKNRFSLTFGPLKDLLQRLWR